MVQILIGALGAVIGALATLAVTWWLNRNSATRAARRQTYLDLLIMLKAAVRVQNLAVLDHSTAIPELVSEEKIDEFNARLDIDASREVRRLARTPFQLMRRFQISHTMKAPVEIDAHGMFNYRFDLVRGVDEETAALHMRMALGKIHGQLETAVDRLADQMRRELHGRRS
ncbi:hypothetical protein [Kribbella solani]|uniref:Uncharacterized protein n=1 Tax=Kribbella solani TaxID=236067 RepID=A0A841DXY5_9ACTN|nr:hypothetical protein [Kribbella solani]MBB5981655.1 hypothetical protein [Kribbella solani]